MKIERWLLIATILAAATAAQAQDRVVYDVNDAPSKALSTLRSIRNHLDTDPSAKVTVVTHAQGVDFLMEGANDRNGAPYSALVAALVNRGVKFEICEITLKSRDLKRDRFILEAEFTPSGMVRITKLQIQGYAYIKP